MTETDTVDEYTGQMYSDALEWWVEALESGEFPQTRGTMCLLDDNEQPAGYCCLAVLCELAIRHGVPVITDKCCEYRESFRTYDGLKGSYLPHSVVVWAGLSSALVQLGPWVAAYYNDEREEDFPTIAAAIRRYVRPIPRPE